ncbi:uncharacterized protein [Rutidosis leptorrhynchoides]|uniref:uncharacterized protein n=1 Tax=Rutidosis leptorrhynchoides TaxID=125765 RepID=UPI003A9937D5
MIELDLCRNYIVLMKIVSLNIRGFGLGGKVGKFGWVKRLIAKEKPTFLAIQESRLKLVVDKWICSLWGSPDFEFIQREKVGKSGGQLLVWDKNCFEALDVFRIDCVIGIQGVWKPSGDAVNILNIYGPHDDAKKIKLWDELSKLLANSNDAWILCGDFNEVREESDRFNCDFLEYRARRFNEFIANNSLIEIPLGGRKFTRVSDDGVKFSKLDRFFVSEKCLDIWKDLVGNILERKHSDHCPILLKNENLNFGPKPFKVFDTWFNEDEADQIVKNAWERTVPKTYRKDRTFMNKLKNVKFALKEWSSKKIGALDGEIEASRSVATNLELKAETTNLSEEEKRQ